MCGSSKRCCRPSEKEVSLVSARIGNDPTFIERVATEGHACYVSSWFPPIIGKAGGCALRPSETSRNEVKGEKAI